MNLNKLKYVSIAICCVVTALWTETQCMEEVSQPEKEISKNAQSSPTPEEEKCCSHWGISHWFSGIKEYTIDRCLLGGFGFNADDPDRAYITRKETSAGNYSVKTSDCCFVNEEVTPCLLCAADDNGGCVGALCCPVRTLLATISCPLVSLCHILSLPFVCCESTPHQTIRDYTLDMQRADADQARDRCGADVGGDG